MSRTADDEWKWRRREAIIRDEYECQGCGAKGGPEGDSFLHVHHEAPKNDGGSDDLDNLTTLCKSCHRQEHAEMEGNSGHFKRKYSDETFLKAVRESNGGGTTEAAEYVGCNRRTAYLRLQDLEEQGRVISREVGNS